MEICDPFPLRNGSLLLEEPMEITKPSYYDSFRCLASRCPDSCCKEWDVDVDDASAARYRDLPGALGERLRSVLKDTQYGVQMAAENGRCPMWRDDGPCRIQAELGEGALCDVCREFPRLRHDYGDFMELGLELSCPEAARLILTAPAAPAICTAAAGGGQPDYDGADMALLKQTRTAALELLAGHETREALALLLLYGAAAQQGLDTGEMEDFDIPAALETGRSLRQTPDMPGFFRFFRELEILTPRWAALLRTPAPLRFPPEMKAFARYLVERYWLQAISDFDLMGRVKFIVISCLLVGSLPGDFAANAQLFSKEIENDADNVDAILDAAGTYRPFTDSRLLGSL